jgi:hypothetical protein
VRPTLSMPEMICSAMRDVSDVIHRNRYRIGRRSAGAQLGRTRRP